jgi:hypothetical protein
MILRMRRQVAVKCLDTRHDEVFLGPRTEIAWLGKPRDLWSWVGPR